VAGGALTIMPPLPGRARALDVSVTAVPSARADARGLGAWLSRAAPRGARGSVAVAVVTDVRMRGLNRTWRRVDAPTDVLSFPAADQGETGFLGDLAIAAGVAGRQARAHGHSRRVELRILALHGLLHLLGYDHEADEGEMRSLEERLRRRAGLPGGLIARVPGGRRRRSS
jgi:probable rRNA maturation factor